MTTADASISLINTALRQAAACHHAGRLPEAEQLYRVILQVRPDHPDVNHNLGVLLGQTGRPAAGLAHLKAALEADPAQGDYWLSYADALLACDQAEDALAVIRTAMEHGLDTPQVRLLRDKAEAAGRTAGISNTTGTVGISGKNTKESSPLPQAERNRLIDLFNNGRHAEMESLARVLCERHRDSGFAWKALGVALQAQGKNALAVLQKATELLPDDADAHNSLGVALKDGGRLDDAVASCRRALKLKPDLAEAHSNLGNALRGLHRLDEAAASYRRALAIKPDYAEAHNNLGVTLRELGQLDGAAASCRRALAIKPDYADACVNLARTLLDQGKMEDAAALSRQAIAVQPHYSLAHLNLGNVLKEMGRLSEAGESYSKAISLAPDSSAGLTAAIKLAVLSYLQTDMARAGEMLALGQAILDKLDHSDRPAQAYYRYLDRLLDWWRTTGQTHRNGDAMETLYAVGDSHVLCVHNLPVLQHFQSRTVTTNLKPVGWISVAHPPSLGESAVCLAQGITLRCRSMWIEGCKQWHLGCGSYNQYKYQFEATMQSIPRQATVLMAFGEIDCRPDEGIIKAWKKSPGKKIEDVISATVKNYLHYVAKIAPEHAHKIIICGVPASNAPLDKLEKKDQARFQQLLTDFNRMLRDNSLALGMDFLDLFAMTDSGNGTSNGLWHIDSNHLRPDAIMEAFEKYYLRAKNSL